MMNKLRRFVCYQRKPSKSKGFGDFERICRCIFEGDGKYVSGYHGGAREMKVFEKEGELI